MNKVILCVDDDEDDVEFLSEALRNENPNINIVSVNNGLRAIEYLNHAKKANEGLPCMIVMDINMPVMDGKQAFKEIRNDPLFTNIPVVFFTSSSNPNDKTLIEKMGSEMFTKPNRAQYLKVMAKHFLTKCK